MSAADDGALLARLRAGDSAAFDELVGARQASLIRLATTFVPSHAVAEEVAQDTWIAVIKGLDRFEQRSSLTTWITSILVNIARTRGAKERRTVPMAALASADIDDGPSVDADRFVGPPGRGAWAVPPPHWSDVPDAAALTRETFAAVVATVRELPENQRWVVMLRDVEDWSTAEVCALLGISEGNQRVLLHRGRSTVRAALEDQLGARR